MFIIDFDHTLYDTHAFLECMRVTCARHGISKDLFESSYYVARLQRDERGPLDYSFERHIDVLTAQGYVLPRVEILAELEACISKKHVFDDAIEFLEYVKSTGHEMMLLSAGNAIFQQKKVLVAGIADYFQSCVYVHGDKEEYVYEHVHDEEGIFFINDNVQENLDMHKKMSHIHIITKFNLHKYSREDMEKSGIPYAETLHQIIEIAQRLLEI